MTVATSPGSTIPELDADVVIVGAGLAGASAAFALANRGLRVTLVDRQAVCLPCFKAEKIEPDQVHLLKSLNVMDVVRPCAEPISTVHRAQGGRVIRQVHTEQYGANYHDMVNAVRSNLPAGATTIVDRAQDVATGPHFQRVTLASGRMLTSRLLVVACGTGGDFQSRLGLTRRWIQKEQSLALAFTVARRDGHAFPFRSMTYYPNGTSSRIAYATFFPIGETVRVNMFAFWSNSENQTRHFVREPEAELERLLPGLKDVVGELVLTDRVETSRIDLYQVDDPARDGLVLLADAFQSVCPTTGTGLSKVLTDVDVLCNECVPRWFATPGMSASKIGEFYGHSRKRAVDQHSLDYAQYARRLTTDTAPVWRLRRVAWRIENRFAGLARYFKLTRNATA